MIILHILSNWKWTERSEPSALLARAQQDAGMQIHFFCDRAPVGAEGTVADRAGAFGLPVTSMALPKHARLWDTWRGVRALRRHLMTIKPDVVHCHMPGAHWIAALAARSVQPASCLIRSCYDPEGHELGKREHWLRRPVADGVIVIADPARQRLEQCGIDPARIAVIEPGIDLERFTADGIRRDTPRQRWDLATDAFVIGMVTRIRRDRGTHLAVDLLDTLRDRLPQARVLLVGRGSAVEIRHAVTQPAARRNVADRLIMAGYQIGDDLVAAYRAMDVLFYPRPGTDRSCRTIREAMAAGLPVLAGNEGFVPNLVADGITGFVSDLSTGSLTARIIDLASKPQLRQRMATAAMSAARKRFDLNRQAQRTIAFYRNVIQGT